MTRMLSIATCLLALTAAAQGPRGHGTPPDRVVKFLPLHDLVEEPEWPAPIESPPQREYGEEPYDALSLGNGGSSLRVSADTIVELVAYDIERRGLPPLDIRLESTSLFLSGDPKSVDAAERMLAELRASVGCIVQIEARLFQVTGEVPPMPVMLPEQIERPMRGLAEVWRARSTTRVGRPTRLERTENKQYVRDVDVEVASQQAIGDPKVQRFLDGVQVAAQAHRLAGTEELLLYAQVYFASGSVEYGVRGTGNDLSPLDVPRIASAAGTLAGRIQPGGALAFWCLGDSSAGPQFVLAVRASLVPVQQPAGLADVAILPISALAAGRLLVPGPRLPDGERGEDSIEEEEPQAFGLLSDDTIQQLVHEVLVADQEDLEVTLQVVGDSLFVAPVDGAMRACAEGMLVALQDAAFQGVHLEAVTEVDGGGQAGAVHRLVWPGLLGRRNVAMRLIETTEIFDYEVEIAQEASVVNPVVGTVVSGVNCEVRPFAAAGDRFARARVELLGAGPVRRWGSETKEAASLWQIDVGLGRFLHLGLVPADGRLELGQGPRVDMAGGSVATKQVLVIR